MKLGLVFLISLMSAAAWSFGFSWVYFQFYVALGAPDHPILLLRAAIPGISFVFGVVGGLLASLPGRRVPFAPHIYFLTSAAFVLGVAGFAAGFSAVLDQLKNQGFWAFLLGALAVFLLARWRPATQLGAAGDGPRPAGSARA